MNPGVYEILARVQGEEDAVKRQVLMDETRDELTAHFVRNIDEFEELAYDLLNNAWSDAIKNDIVDRIINVKTVDFAAVDYFDEDLRGGRAYWQGSGGQIRSFLVRYERQQMPREAMVTAIDLHRNEVRTDFWGGMQKLIDQSNMKLRGLPTERLIELVQAAISSGSTYAEYAAATLSSTQVDEVLDEVLTNSPSATILGTGPAIRKLSNIGLDFGQNIQEQIFRTGLIGVYKGQQVASIENFENFDGFKVLPDDEIWIVGRNAGQLTYYGNDALVQQLALEAFYLRWETEKAAGMVVHAAERKRLGRIKLT